MAHALENLTNYLILLASKKFYELVMPWTVNSAIYQLIHNIAHTYSTLFIYKDMSHNHKLHHTEVYVILNNVISICTIMLLRILIKLGMIADK